MTQFKNREIFGALKFHVMYLRADRLNSVQPIPIINNDINKKYD